MITSIAFLRNNQPPVLASELKPGDWFVFEPTITAEPWVMMAPASDIHPAVHLLTGRRHYFVDSDDTNLWRVQAQVTLTARPPSV